MLNAVLTLPIAQREMLVLAKSPGFYRARIGTSIGLLTLGIGLGIIYTYAGLRIIAEIVQMLSFVLFTICMFAGVQLTSDSISREKREGTLGLLFLTHMSPFQIVLGKLIAHGLMGFYWVLITIPLLSLLLIVGGMRGSELATMGIVGLNMIFFSASVGLFASTFNTERKKAAGTGTWIIMFFWWGIPLIVQLLQYFQLPQWLCEGLGVISLAGAFNSPFAGPRTRMIDSPWVHVLSTHLLAWMFTGLAVFTLKRKWQEHPQKPKFSIREWWKQMSLGKPETRLQLRQRLLDLNPFLWLASRDRLRPFVLWLVTIVTLGLLALVLPAGLGAVGLFASLIVTLCMLHKFLLAGSAGHQLIIEQEQGTLEMLISTPLRVEDVLRGQFSAVLRQFKGPATLAFLLQLLGTLGVLYFDSAGVAQWKMNLVAFYLGLNTLIYLFDLYTLLWVGMWSALIVRDPKNAGGAAISRVMILPCLVFAVIILSVTVSNIWLQSPINLQPTILAPLWFALGIGNNVAWLVYVRKRLPDRLRTFALRRYSPEEKQSWFSVIVAKLRPRATTPPVIATLPHQT